MYINQQYNKTDEIEVIVTFSLTVVHDFELLVDKTLSITA